MWLIKCGGNGTTDEVLVEQAAPYEHRCDASSFTKYYLQPSNIVGTIGGSLAILETVRIQLLGIGGCSILVVGGVW